MASTKASRVGYAAEERSASHIRSPSSAGAGIVTLMAWSGQPSAASTALSRAASAAITPSRLGESGEVTKVAGRPSSNVPSSKPCAISAMTPMYERRPSSPSVTTSQPAVTCMATAEVIAESSSAAWTASGATAGGSGGAPGCGSTRSLRKAERGSEPTTDDGKSFFGAGRGTGAAAPSAAARAASMRATRPMTSCATRASAALCTSEAMPRRAASSSANGSACE